MTFSSPPHGISLTNFVTKNLVFAWMTIVVALLYFVLIRLLYPVPSYFSDSFTFVGAAANNYAISFRPILYSKLIQFFQVFAATDVALVAGQYLSLVLANLFLFYTTCWVFQFNRTLQWILFALLIAHPFYVFAGNYVSSDAFFTSFTIAWFALLLWIMYKPTWYNILAHLALLTMLFLLRYNAISFPVLTGMALVFSGLRWWKKIAWITAACGLILSCMLVTAALTKKMIGTQVFSPFGGWQLANNALHVVRNNPINSRQIKDQQVLQLLLYCQQYFDTTKGLEPAKGTSWYMWAPESPLKKYMNVGPGNKGYFTKWVQLGPLYSNFGKAVILQNPMAYIKDFVLPNTRAYLHPQLEIYETYFEGKDTIPTVVQKYFHYSSNKVSPHRPQLYKAVFSHLPVLFTITNVLVMVMGLWYLFSKRYQYHTLLLNRFLFLFYAFFLANFFFIILLAPSVFRYHAPLLILSFPIVLFFISALTGLPGKSPSTELKP